MNGEISAGSDDEEDSLSRSSSSISRLYCDSYVASLSPASSYYSSTDDYSDNLNHESKYVTSSSSSSSSSSSDDENGEASPSSSDYDHPHYHSEPAKKRPSGLPRIFKFSPKTYGPFKIDWSARFDRQEPERRGGAKHGGDNDEELNSYAARAKEKDLWSKTCQSCSESESPYWVGCDSECYKKRGSSEEPKLSPFLRYLMANRDLDVR